MKTLEEASAKVAALEAELVAEKRARIEAKDKHRTARRKVRLDVAAKAQRRIADLQRMAATKARPSSWIDGAMHALDAMSREVSAIADDEPEET